jgi:hypothetical protein
MAKRVSNPMRKIAAHDKFVCLDCRWTAKLPLVDVRVADRPSYRCPKCNKGMLWTGTAFRPPRKDDDEAWRVVEALLNAGFRFRSTRLRQRYPRSAKELDRWLQAQRESDRWLPERKVLIEAGKPHPIVRCGRRKVGDREGVLLWLHGLWAEGRVILFGDGRRPLASPVVKLQATRQLVPLTSRSRLRLPANPPKSAPL